MVPRSSAVCALSVCLGLLTAAVPGAAATAAATPPDTATAPVAYEAPLRVEIHNMTPAHLPDQGRIRVTGTVTNVDDVTWDEIKLYPFFGDEAPMTTREQLAEASSSNPLLEVGGRVTAASADVDALAPDASESFSLSVPRSELDTAGAGVYWFGVHAMGQSDEQSRDLVADGRARTFLPYVPRARRDPERVAGRIKSAVVVPLRRHLPYAADGSLDRVGQWEKTIANNGRLRSLVDFGIGAGASTVTWLVDPALLDSVSRLGQGNPPRSLAPTEPVDGEEPPTPEESPTAEPTTDAGTDTESEPDSETDRVAGSARTWLNRAQQVLEDDEVLSLPYGDMDVDAAAETHHDLYRLARERPGAVMAGWDVNPRPALESPNHHLAPAVFDLVGGDDSSAMLVTDEMFGDDPPGVARVDGHKVGVISSGVASGGPAPGDRFSSLQLRQRILSEAATRLLGNGRHPLIAVMPRQWHGERPASFFNGLEDAGWFDLTTYADATSRDGRAVEASELEYPEELRAKHADPAMFEAATDLIAAGETLQSLLTRNDEVAAEVTNQALTGPSYGARIAPRLVARSMAASRAEIRDQLSSVSIDAGPGVTLSSRDGGFAAVLTNKLDHAVTVQVQAINQNGMEITPPEPIQLRGGGRTTVVLDAHAQDIGVHRVSLQLTDLDGNQIGSGDVVSIRSSEVSSVIWLILGLGCGLLLLAIAIRLVRRIRRARGAAGGTEAGGAPPDPADAAVEDPARPVESSP